MTTIIHLSDVHFGDADATRLVAAIEAIKALKPDCLVLTGDLTQQGKAQEFADAVRWLAQLDLPIVGCPGNHDTPMFNLPARLFRPFGRFEALGMRSAWQSSDGWVEVIAATTALGTQWTFDWSQGDYGQASVRQALDNLAQSTAKIRLLAVHHPPETPPGAYVKSNPRGLLQFNQWLAQTCRPDLLLCGHVHGYFDFSAAATQGLRVLTVPSLASRRERGAGSGFAVIRLKHGDHEIRPEMHRFSEGRYRPS